MKKKKIIIVLVVILIVLIEVLLFFFFDDIKKKILLNKVNNMSDIIKNLDEGTYSFKSGIIYDKDDNIINDVVYLDGNGKIIKDKYNNTRISIETDKYCINKTSTKVIKITEGTCKHNNIIKYEISKNNKTLSFSFHVDIVAYKLSDNDDYVGEWIKVKHDKKENLIINFATQGKYYIWFKDKYGNISNSKRINIECFFADNATFDKNIIYCPGSVVNIDNMKWIIMSENEEEITLFSLESVYKASHCIKESGEICYKNSDGMLEYKWSNSAVNSYLNNVFIRNLNSNIIESIVEKEICNMPSGTKGCDSDDGCGGYKKETIEKYKWSCNEYTKSKIRLISFEEYSNLYDSIYDKSIVKGHYWTMNSNKESLRVTSILKNYEVYVKEDALTELDIRPVITISK